MTEEGMIQGTVQGERPKGAPTFLKDLLNKRVRVQPLSGQPITGTLIGYNAYEIRVEVPNQAPLVVYKHAIYHLQEILNPLEMRSRSK
ncbi:MAG: hypothetical protein JW986_09100 [Methanotrichaceae archaeon]|nr:hypothetical protein [Methanotrichaceae archaeon]